MNIFERFKLRIQSFKRSKEFYKKYYEYHQFLTGEVIFMPKWVYYYRIPIWWWETYFDIDEDYMLTPSSKIGKWIYNLVMIPVRRESKIFYDKIVYYTQYPNCDRCFPNYARRSYLKPNDQKQHEIKNINPQ